MGKKLIFILLCAILQPVSASPQATDKPKLWRESFIEVQYYKNVDSAGSIIYQYVIKNIGNVPLGRINLGDNANTFDCEVPPENIKEMTTSLQEWMAEFEVQTENPNRCIKVHNLNRDYPLEPGKKLTITLVLYKDDPIFENMHWEAIFIRFPTRIGGDVKRGDYPM